MSTESAGLAKKLGYTNVKVMLKGAPGWKKSGRFLVAADEFVNTGNIVLVDLRPAEEAAKGHVKGAVNIPAPQFEDAVDDIPAKAPIVLYGAEADTTAAIKLLSGKGIKMVSLLDGGVDGFVARGNSLATGAPATDIVWVRKPGKGEVLADEFQKAAAGEGGKVILDVRTADETGAGRFASAVTIPLDVLEKRAGELPKDKEILIHCSTGARAEMAHDLLQKQGYQSRFLVADVDCKAVGQCTVE